MRVDFSAEELLEIRLLVGGNIDIIEESFLDFRDREDPSIDRKKQRLQLALDECILEKIHVALKRNKLSIEASNGDKTAKPKSKRAI